MSDHHRAILRWKKNSRSMTMMLYGERIKAGYILEGVWNKLYAIKRRDHLRYAMGKIKYDKDRIVRSSLEKMVRAAGLNMERTFKLW
jgi:hypothetical protein